MKTEKEIKEILLDEIKEEFRDSNIEVESIDMDNQTITFKFSFHIVEEDNYIGLNSY